MDWVQRTHRTLVYRMKQRVFITFIVLGVNGEVVFAELAQKNNRSNEHI